MKYCGIKELAGREKVIYFILVNTTPHISHWVIEEILWYDTCLLESKHGSPRNRVYDSVHYCFLLQILNIWPRKQPIAALGSDIPIYSCTYGWSWEQSNCCIHKMAHLFNPRHGISPWWGPVRERFRLPVNITVLRINQLNFPIFHLALCCTKQGVKMSW